MEYIIRINDNDIVDSDGNKRIEEMHELVRCKNCKRYYANGGNCDQVLAEWFCADGGKAVK